MGATARDANHSRSRRSKGRGSNQLDIRVVLSLRVDDHSLARHHLVGRCKKRGFVKVTAHSRCDATRLLSAQKRASSLRTVWLVLCRLVRLASRVRSRCEPDDQGLNQALNTVDHSCEASRRPAHWELLDCCYA
jgi:hypothetical protein